MFRRINIQVQWGMAETERCSRRITEAGVGAGPNLGETDGGENRAGGYDNVRLRREGVTGAAEVSAGKERVGA